MAFDITKVSGQGTENLETSSSIPFIRILQDLSPQLKKQKEEYVEGAESGDLFFAKTKKTLTNPTNIIPTYTQSVYTEWVPRSQGGGFVATHPLTIVSHKDYEKGRERQYDEWLGENELRFTTYWFVLAEIDGVWEKAIIPFTSSQLRVSRKLTQDINSFRYNDDALKSIVPPLYAQKWELSTVLETNKNGDDYYNFQFSNPSVLDMESDEALLTEASATYSSAADTPILQTSETPKLVGTVSESDPF
jgi:hypothetical protein